METITLADGTVIENAHLLEDDDNLYFYVPPTMTMAEVFNLMNDETKTAVIKGFRYQVETVYRGYTDLWSISRDKYQISGRLRSKRS